MYPITSFVPPIIIREENFLVTANFSLVKKRACKHLKLKTKEFIHVEFHALFCSIFFLWSQDGLGKKYITLGGL